MWSTGHDHGEKYEFGASCVRAIIITRIRIGVWKAILVCVLNTARARSENEDLPKYFPFIERR